MGCLLPQNAGVSIGGETGDEVAAKKQKETVQALDTEELPEIHTRHTG